MLTAHQRRILVAYAGCWSRKQTAAQLGISEGAVRGVLHYLHRRFDVATTGELYVVLGALDVSALCPSDGLSDASDAA